MLELIYLNTLTTATLNLPLYLANDLVINDQIVANDDSASTPEDTFVSIFLPVMLIQMNID